MRHLKFTESTQQDIESAMGEDSRLTQYNGTYKETHMQTCMLANFGKFKFCASNFIESIHSHFNKLSQDYRFFYSIIVDCSLQVIDSLLLRTKLSY